MLELYGILPFWMMCFIVVVLSPLIELFVPLIPNPDTSPLASCLSLTFPPTSRVRVHSHDWHVEISIQRLSLACYAISALHHTFSSALSLILPEV